MEITQKCPKCGEDMKIVPAGISKKTGNPYNAFLSCKNYGCGTTVELDSNEAPGSNSSPYGDYKKQPPKDFKATMDYKGEQIGKFQDSKEEGMRLMSSGRDAVLMVTAIMNQGSAWNEEQLKGEISKWRNWFYTNIYKMSKEEYETLNSPF